MSRIEQALRRAQQTELESASVPEEAPPVDALLAVRAAAASAPKVEGPRAVATPAPAPTSAPAVAEEPAPAATSDRWVVDEKLVASPDISPAVAEQYRKLAVVLHQRQQDRGATVVMMASAISGDGKTLTATNLAFTLSESFRQRVLLIDADLRRPSVQRVLGLGEGPGLNEGLSAPEDQKLTITEISPRLSVLPAGRPNPDPMGSLTSKRMREIIQEAKTRFDWVILDTPPLDLLPDASLLAEMADAVVLVVSAGHTPFRSIERAVNLVDRKRIVGVVLNRVVDSRSSSYYGYYGTPAKQ